jgi:hypothetical protein
MKVGSGFREKHVNHLHIGALIRFDLDHPSWEDPCVGDCQPIHRTLLLRFFYLITAFLSRGILFQLHYYFNTHVLTT